MRKADLLELLSPAGLTLVESIDAAAAEADPVGTVQALRRAGHAPELVTVALSQAGLRHRARAKFGDFAERMLFTPAGLEQATRLRVAARHAGRFRDAGLAHVADLGCGLGTESLALASLGLRVLAVEADEVTAALAAFNLAPFPDVEVVHGLAEEADLSGIDGLFLDPARRTAGHSDTRRLSDPEAYSPTLGTAFALAERLPTGIKLGPGLDRTLIPAGVEAQWVSVDGQLVEMTLWSGVLARPGITRSALVLSPGGAAELTGAADGHDPEPRPLGAFLYEPDGAVFRARQLGALAEQLDAGTVDPTIAYLTADTLQLTPFAAAFAVREVFPLDLKTIKRELRERGIGRLEIKKRGVDIDPARFRTQLHLRGDAEAVLILTRAAGRRVAILAERVARASTGGADAGARPA